MTTTPVADQPTTETDALTFSVLRDAGNTITGQLGEPGGLLAAADAAR